VRVLQMRLSIETVVCSAGHRGNGAHGRVIDSR
jgi:hypothetical protein